MLPSLLRTVEAKGHKVFQGGDYDLNLVAQRGPSRIAGQMDDLLTVAYQMKGRWYEVSWPCSVDPGVHSLAHPGNPKGTAILAPGQYRSSHARGLHKGRQALVQVGPVSVGRDGDKDNILEPGVRDTGIFGINIHDDVGAGAEASAGCIVLAKEHLLELLMVVFKAAPKWGERVTLTVIE